MPIAGFPNIASPEEYNAWRVRVGLKALVGEDLKKAWLPYATLRGYKPPVAPQPQFVDPRLPRLQADLQAIPGAYNDQRKMDANALLRQLLTSGLTDQGGLDQVAVDSGVPDGQGGNQQNITYKLVVAPNGRAFRQAFRSVVSNAASRGFLESSDTNRQVSESRGQLTQSVRDALASLADSQRGSLQKQQSDIAGVGGQISGVQSEVAARLAEQTPPQWTGPGTVKKAMGWVDWNAAQRRRHGDWGVIGSGIRRAGYFDYLKRANYGKTTGGSAVPTIDPAALKAWQAVQTKWKVA